MSHYALEKSVTGKRLAVHHLLLPPKMFSDAQTTLDVLATLEDAFIAASSRRSSGLQHAALRVLAARIMGIQSDHRTLARVLAGDVSPRDGGPIKKLTGVRGKAEEADPPISLIRGLTSGRRRSRAAHRLGRSRGGGTWNDPAGVESTACPLSSCVSSLRARTSPRR